MENTSDSALRVLIVEDDPCYQRLLERYVCRGGGSVGVAEDGRSGLEKILTGRYDLVFLDIQLPQLDGFMVATMCREQGCSLPLIGMSAFRLEGMASKAAAVGFSDFIHKPISEPTVQRFLAEYAQPVEQPTGHSV